MENTLDLVQAWMKKQGNVGFEKFGPYCEIPKHLYFAAAAQATSDFFNSTGKIAMRPSIPESDDIETVAEVIEILSWVSETTKKWVKFTRFESEDKLSLNIKLQAALLQVEGLKSVIVLLCAGYNYFERFDSEGEILKPAIAESYGAYV